MWVFLYLITDSIRRSLKHIHRQYRRLIILHSSTTTTTHQTRIQVSLSTFAYLFSELVQYYQARVSNVGDLERRLEEVGYGVGLRLLEILTFRERAGRREIRLLDMLRFIHSTLWKYLFGRQAKDLEQSNTVSFLMYTSHVCFWLQFNAFIRMPLQMLHQIKLNIFECRLMMNIW